MNVTKTKRRSKRDIEENEEDEVTNLELLTEEVLEDFGSYQKVRLLTPCKLPTAVALGPCSSADIILFLLEFVTAPLSHHQFPV